MPFAVLGFTVVLLGIAMLVLPGPGLLVIAVGLGMLALEFAWAERVLERTLERMTQTGTRVRRLTRLEKAASLAGGLRDARCADRAGAVRRHPVSAV